jgi:hypothetical protein
MTLEGLIDRSSYLVINQQEAPYFPYVLSTELYPQWALAKMYHVGNELAEQMMLTFFDINPNSEAARTARIQGWTIPLDYLSGASLPAGVEDRTIPVSERASSAIDRRSALSGVQVLGLGRNGPISDNI